MALGSPGKWPKTVLESPGKVLDFSKLQSLWTLIIVKYTKRERYEHFYWLLFQDVRDRPVAGTSAVIFLEPWLLQGARQCPQGGASVLSTSQLYQSPCQYSTQLQVSHTKSTLTHRGALQRMGEINVSGYLGLEI